MTTKELRVPSPGELWCRRDAHHGNSYFRVKVDGKMIALRSSFSHVADSGDPHHTSRYFIHAVEEALQEPDKNHTAEPDKIVNGHDGWKLIANDWRVFVADKVASFIEDRLEQNAKIWKCVEELELGD